MEYQEQYKNILKFVLERGTQKSDRTGTGTISYFAPPLIDVKLDKFPLMTLKKLNFKWIAHELFWFLRGDTNTKYLNDHGIPIWNSWADETGDLGPIYGAQWRNWGGKDQLKELLQTMKTNPSSRRHLLSCWNYGELEKMKLPPCLPLVQFYINDDKISTKVTARSIDLFLGLPIDMAVFSLLTHLVAWELNYKPDRCIFSIGDAHIYSNHMEQCNEIIKRAESNTIPELPDLELVVTPDLKSIFDFKLDNLKCINYHPLSAIKAPVSI